MIKEISISTLSRNELVDITSKVNDIVKSSKINSGICHIFVPHTTAGITINENADPDVRRDILMGLERIAPLDGNYEHSEGNADSHIKSTLVGTDKTLLIEKGKLVFGTWQGIFFCEFDGPRHRKIIVKISEK